MSDYTGDFTDPRLQSASGQLKTAVTGLDLSEAMAVLGHHLVLMAHYSGVSQKELMDALTNDLRDVERTCPGGCHTRQPHGEKLRSIIQ